ncbi:MAG: hypothetical protein ABW101_08860 [Candidatus Thiodiazotropha sp.]
MNLKNKAWKYATVFVVSLIILNPETIHLALFIDSVGLEILLMMFEIQVVLLIGMYLNSRIKPILDYLRHFIRGCIYMVSWKSIKEEPAYLIYAVPSQATLMHALIILAVVGCCV